MIIEGALSVKAAIKGKNRNVFEIYIDKSKKSKDINYIKNLASQDGIKINFINKNEIDKLASGKSHGGILAKVSNRMYQDISDCFNENSFVALIEGVEDPFNLGYIYRTLYSAGCSGVIVNKRDYKDFENVILKSSAGAFDLINIYQSDNLQNSIEFAKNKGCVVYTAMRKDAISYFECDFKIPVLIAIGGEMRGLSKVVLENSDKNIYIPYGNEFKNALNASSAVAAISYEVLRQRLSIML